MSRDYTIAEAFEVVRKFLHQSGRPPMPEHSGISWEGGQKFCFTNTQTFSRLMIEFAGDDGKANITEVVGIVEIGPRKGDQVELSAVQKIDIVILEIDRSIEFIDAGNGGNLQNRNVDRIRNALFAAKGLLQGLTTAEV